MNLRAVWLRALTPLAVIALLAVLFSASPARQAEAHANQIRSSPSPDSELEESPERVIVWFSEEIEESLSEVRVLDEFARQVDNEDSALSPTEPTALIVTMPELENGTYTVVWRNLSTVDGHRVVGSFRFAVGEPLAAGSGIPVESQPIIQSGADPWLRWVYIIGALALAGTLIFDLLVLRPMFRPTEPSQPSRQFMERLQPVMSQVMLVSVGLMALGLVSLLVQQASLTFQVSVFNVLGNPINSVLDSEWGRSWTWRALAVVASGALVVLARRSTVAPVEAGDDEQDGNQAPSDEFEGTMFTESIFGILALAGSLAVLALTSLSSHNAAVPVELRTPAIISDFIHLIAASAWIGGLFLIGLAIPALARSDGSMDRTEQVSALLKRFSPLAMISAGTLIVTGIFAWYMQVTIPAATNTPYGWTMVTKIILLVPLFGFAGLNSYIVTRHLIRSGPLKLIRSIRAEALIAVLVLAAVGWLIGLEPARQFAGRNGIGVADQVTFSDFVERANIDFALEPGDVGVNTATIYLTDRNGDPITNANDVRVRIKFLEEDLGEPLISLVDQGDGAWSRDDFNLTIGGVYQVEIRVVRPDAFDAITSFRFDAAPVAAAADAIRPTRTATWSLFALALLAIGGLMLLFAAPALRRLFAHGRAIAVPGALFSVAGVALLLNAQVFKAGFPEDRFNPFPLNSESIEIGRALYATTCTACHGDGGLGDGPQSARLSSPPADLSVHVPLHTDSELFGFIRDGIPGTAMGGQQGILDEDEMWHLVNFLRTFER